MMKRTRQALTMTTLGLCWLLWSTSLPAGDRPVQVADKPASTGADEDAARNATQILEAVHTGYFHFDPDVPFAATCTVRKDDKQVGELDLRFNGPGNFHVRFRPNDAAGNDDVRIEKVFREVMAAAMIEPILPDHGFTARLLDEGFALNMGGAEVRAPAKSCLLALNTLRGTEGQEFYLISGDNQVLRYAIENIKKHPGPDGATYTLKTGRADNRCYVDAVAMKMWDSAVRTSYDVQFTYSNKNGRSFVKRIEIASSDTLAQLRTVPEVKSARWVITTDSVEFKGISSAPAGSQP
jgi:hypothetical protein